MTSRQTWRVDSSEAGSRLDRFLAQPGRLGSRRRAAAAIESGKIFVNDAEAGRAAGGAALSEGDVVAVWMDRPGTARRRPRPPAATGGLVIVYEDDALIVLDKPAGLLTVPLERRAAAPSLVDEIERHLRPRGKRKPLVVHRIDRDTSGLVVFAKEPRARDAIRRQFLHQEPERVYLAVVYGHPSPAAGTWRDHLVWDHRALVQKATHVRDPRGKEAIATYRVVESFAATSLIEVRLQTGKRNQIRLQARLRGHTLVGEQRYTFGPEILRPVQFHRQALHAWRLSLRHPTTDVPLSFEAPLPPDFADLLSGLRARRTPAEA